MNEKYIYIFVHIPKTAGGTFRTDVIENLPPSTYLNTSFTYIGTYYNIKTKRNEIFKDSVDFLNYVKSLTDKEKGRIVFLAGHSCFYGIHKLCIIRRRQL